MVAAPESTTGPAEPAPHPGAHVVARPTPPEPERAPVAVAATARPEPAGDGTTADAVTAAGLPRRTPAVAPVPEPPATVTAPPARSPDKVFELIARYEAGRRRAQAQPDDTGEDRS